jgi:tetratricopeptide (TPR) repeat protein
MNPMINLLYFVLLLLTPSFAYSSELIFPHQKQLDEAFISYQKGEQAKTYPERQAHFNRALALYSELETSFSDPLLFYNIANCYFQLREYPWAILYYKRAERLQPRNTKIHNNLDLARTKLGIAPEKSNTVFNKLLSFHRMLSEEERLRAFFLLGMGTVGLASVTVWMRHRLLIEATIIMGACAFLVFGSLITSRYYSPVEAIVIQSTVLYRDAGIQYASVKEEPVAAGMQVSVVEVLQNKRWLKIISPEGITGYVPQESVRFI